jgi:hypothetical protein
MSALQGPLVAERRQVQRVQQSCAAAPEEHASQAMASEPRAAQRAILAAQVSFLHLALERHGAARRGTHAILQPALAHALRPE